jgi:hypothetical protein
LYCHTQVKILNTIFHLTGSSSKTESNSNLMMVMHISKISKLYLIELTINLFSLLKTLILILFILKLSVNLIFLVMVKMEMIFTVSHLLLQKTPNILLLILISKLVN